MFWFPMLCSELGAISKIWVSVCSPPPKIFPERPRQLLLANQPLALFCDYPEGADTQAWKEQVNAAFLREGAELPLATSDRNPTTADCSSKGVLKLHWKVVARALAHLGVVSVYVGQYGTKLRAPVFLKEIGGVGQPSQPQLRSADVAVQTAFHGGISLFGIAGGRCSLPAGVLDTNPCQLFVHEIFPGLADPQD